MTKKSSEVSYFHFAHRELWHARGILTRLGEETGEGGAYASLAALAFTYFALEAFLNHVIDAIAPDTWEAERTFFTRELSGTLGKLQWLDGELSIRFDRGVRPYQTVVELERRRHLIVHPKPEYGQQTVGYGEDALPIVDVGLGRLASSEFLARASEDIQVVCDRIHQEALPRASGGTITGARAFIGRVSGQAGWLA